MSTPYERVRGGKLTFKGGLGAEKSIDKKKNKKKKKNPKPSSPAADEEALGTIGEKIEIQDDDTNAKPVPGIDPTSKKIYEELFPVEARKFGYADLKAAPTAEKALDERIKKKADRYCK